MAADREFFARQKRGDGECRVEPVAEIGDIVDPQGAVFIRREGLVSAAGQMRDRRGRVVGLGRFVERRDHQAPIGEPAEQFCDGHAPGELQQEAKPEPARHARIERELLQRNGRIGRHARNLKITV